MTGKLRCTWIWRSCVLSVLLLPAQLHAEAAADACPDRAAVLRALRALSARDSRAALAEDQLQLTTADSGDSYSVSVNGRTRSYTDPGRDCAARAQVAAVFAALVLSSPNEVDEQAEPSAATPAASAAPPPAPPLRASSAPSPPKPISPAPTAASSLLARRIWLDAGAALALAPSVGGPPIEPGIALGAAYLPRDFGVGIGLRLPVSSAQLPVGDTTARLLRYPVDLVARWLVHAPSFEGTLDAGAVVSLLRLRQTEDSGQASQSRVEAGLRVASRWQFAGTALSPYLELFSEVIPIRYQLALEPTGPLSQTPGWWLGAQLGVSAHFD